MPADATPPPSSGGGSGGGGGIDFSSLSQAEKLVGIGGFAVVAVYVIFELITEDYFVNYVGIVLGAFIVGVVWVKMQRPATEFAVPSNSSLRVAGYLLFVFGLSVAIEQVKNDIFDAEGATLVAALILYAACAVAGIGAKQLD